MSKFNKIEQLAILMRLNKPIGIFLLLWPTLMALWIAGAGHPDPFIVFIFVAGVFVMRSAGCVINDFFDKEFDAKVKRTQKRPLALNKISSKEVLILFAFLITLAFILVLQLNFITILYSFAALFLTTLYPLMKRFTHLPQVILGAAFAWSIPMAFSALEQPLAPNAWILYAATLLWVVAYDTQYGMVDREDDLKIGVKSTAILFGSFDRLIIFLLQLLFLSLFLVLGSQLHFGLFYYAGLLVAGGFVLYQQYLIKNRNPEGCFKAFLNNNYQGAAIFLGIFLDTLFVL